MYDVCNCMPDAAYPNLNACLLFVSRSRHTCSNRNSDACGGSGINIQISMHKALCTTQCDGRVIKKLRVCGMFYRKSLVCLHLQISLYGLLENCFVIKFANHFATADQARCLSPRLQHSIPSTEMMAYNPIGYSQYQILLASCIHLKAMLKT